MNWADERAAFETRVTNNFTAAPVQFPGVKMQPTAGSPWIKMSLLPGMSKRITLGNNAVFREYGTLLFQIFVPAGKGTNPGRVLADQLSAVFHEAHFSYNQSGAIRCRVPVLHPVGDTADGVWNQLNLVIDYERDVVLA